MDRKLWDEASDVLKEMYVAYKQAHPDSDIWRAYTCLQNALISVKPKEMDHEAP